MCSAEWAALLVIACELATLRGLLSLQSCPARAEMFLRAY